VAVSRWAHWCAVRHQLLLARGRGRLIGTWRRAGGDVPARIVRSNAMTITLSRRCKAMRDRGRSVGRRCQLQGIVICVFWIGLAAQRGISCRADL
jgi:hypothetical protein